MIKLYRLNLSKEKKIMQSRLEGIVIRNGNSV